MIPFSMLPDLAISVRQPWAWGLVYAGKDIENRSPGAIKWMERMAPIAGRRAIHASKGMTREEYEEARDFMASIDVVCPPAAELLRGGIIGAVTVTGVVKQSASPWFFGPCGMIIADPQPCEFVPAVGQLGYFKWTPADSSIVPPPARWMLPATPRGKQGHVIVDETASLGLFDEVAQHDNDGF